MPPFSGKKKREQLQSKRQRKREEEEKFNALDRERERLREALVERGEEVNDDILDAYMRERTSTTDRVRGRRAHRKEREQAKAQEAVGAKPTAKKLSSSNRRGKGSDASSEEEGDTGADHGGAAHSKGGKSRPSGGPADTMMYSADRQHGVRSVFEKESAAVLAARRQLSYQPIPVRTTMPATGIPFGEWFTFPSPALAGADNNNSNDRDGTSTPAAEPECRLSRPLVSTTAEALGGGGGGSEVFPFAVELPSRGWHVESNTLSTTEGTTGEEAARGQLVVEPNTLTAPFGVIKHATLSPLKDGDSTETPARVDATAADTSARCVHVNSNADVKEDMLDSSSSSSSFSSSSRSSSGGSGSSTDASSNGDETNNARKRRGGDAANSADARRTEALLIKSIEQTRFNAYAQCLHAYPLPADLTGLDVSSFERNGEVWQQLWRTVEMSDTLVIVADARYPILHSHLGLLSYITKVEKKPCVFVLNKEDLVPASTLRCWRQFLYLYLSDLGFNVEIPSADGKGEAATTATTAMESTANTTDGRIILRTFTANPRPETASQRDGDVDVTRRQKHRKSTTATMYEKLRTGRLNAAKHLSGGPSPHGNGVDATDDEDSSQEDAHNLHYDASDNFVGMQAAQHALQHDQRAYKELEVVAQKITELLRVCRALALTSRAARGIDTRAQGEDGSGNTGVAAPASSHFTTSSLPCAPPRAAQKHKKTRKRRAVRRGGAAAGGEDKEYAKAGESSGADSDPDGRDVLEDRAPDNPAYVHIGFVGLPNVGKSSLLNCIRGTKVVSVSATPGHTKHVQTIPVPEEHMTLVDSPGLALPMFGVPRPLQAVFGTHQIAQTRDPQSGVSYLAAYLPIEKLYGLLRPDYAVKEEGWSSYELCEAFARKRGFFVKHGKGALDIHRAAIAILQEAYEGRLALFYAPPELNLLQSAWYQERIRPNLLLTVFGGPLR